MHFVTPGYKIALANRSLTTKGLRQEGEIASRQWVAHGPTYKQPMKSRIFLVTFATFLTVFISDSAQQAPRWGLGVGAAVPDSVYAGEDTRVTPLPLVAY
jgi:hypothetical protein